MARQPSPRMRKVNELVREVVADAVQDLKDPRIGFVTITGAETSPDLRHAVVYYSTLGGDQEKADSAAALVSATARIQSALGAQTRLRYTPKLTFKVDPSIDEKATATLHGAALDTNLLQQVYYDTPQKILGHTVV